MVKEDLKFQLRVITAGASPVSSSAIPETEESRKDSGQVGRGDCYKLFHDAARVSSQGGTINGPSIKRY